MVDSTRTSAIKYGTVILVVIVGVIVAGAALRMSTPTPADPPDIDTGEEPSTLLNQSICHLQLSNHRYERAVVEHNDSGPDDRYVRSRGVVQNTEYQYYREEIYGGPTTIERYGNDAMGYHRTDDQQWTTHRPSRFGGYTITVTEDGPPPDPRIVERSDDQIFLEVTTASAIYVVGTGGYDDAQEHTLTIALDGDTGRIRRIKRTVKYSPERNSDNFTIMTTIGYNDTTVTRPDDLGFRSQELRWDIYDGRPPTLDCSVSTA